MVDIVVDMSWGYLGKRRISRSVITIIRVADTHHYASLDTKNEKLSALMEGPSSVLIKHKRKMSLNEYVVQLSRRKNAFPHKPLVLNPDNESWGALLSG